MALYMILLFQSLNSQLLMMVYLEHQMMIEVDDYLTQQLNSPQISSAEATLVTNVLYLVQNINLCKL